MTTEGVGETSRFADALSLFRPNKIKPDYFLSAGFKRLLHALQNCGHF